MKRIKIVVALLVVTLILPVMGQMNAQEQKHMIEGVPFVGHDPEWPTGCWLYADQMVLEYLDINITVPEFIYYAGLTKFAYKAPPSPLIMPEGELYPLRMLPDYPFL